MLEASGFFRIFEFIEWALSFFYTFLGSDYGITAEELQRLLNRRNTYCEKYDRKMNIKKTKYMLITKKPKTQSDMNPMYEKV